MKMKRLIIGITVVMLGITTLGFAHSKLVRVNETNECHYGQCQFVKKDGSQCGNCAQQGSSYCWSHNN